MTYGSVLRYRMLHFVLFFFRAGSTWPPCLDEGLAFSDCSSGPRTAMSIAVSKISFTPFISFDEHSM